MCLQKDYLVWTKEVLLVGNKVIGHVDISILDLLTRQTPTVS